MWSVEAGTKCELVKTIDLSERIPRFCLVCTRALVRHLFAYNRGRARSERLHDDPQRHQYTEKDGRILRSEIRGGCELTAF